MPTLPTGYLSILAVFTPPFSTCAITYTNANAPGIRTLYRSAAQRQSGTHQLELLTRLYTTPH
jgi:hypothetical protein